jgi:hypothetical protein
MSNDIAEPRRTGRERKQVEKFEPKRKLSHSRRAESADRSGNQNGKGKGRAVENQDVRDITSIELIGREMKIVRMSRVKRKMGLRRKNIVQHPRKPNEW